MELCLQTKTKNEKSKRFKKEQGRKYLNSCTCNASFNALVWPIADLSRRGNPEEPRSRGSCGPRVLSSRRDTPLPLPRPIGSEEAGPWETRGGAGTRAGVSGVGAGRSLKVAISQAHGAGEQVERPGWPGLRPQASGNGCGGQAGRCECTQVAGGWSRNPLLPVLGALGGDCAGKPPSPLASAAGGGASCAGQAWGAGLSEEASRWAGVGGRPAGPCFPGLRRAVAARVPGPRRVPAHVLAHLLPELRAASAPWLLARLGARPPGSALSRGGRWGESPLPAGPLPWL